MSTDDLPVIRENIKKGFLETQSKMSNWFNNLKKNFNDDDGNDYQNRSPQATQGYNTRQAPQQYGGRRSGEIERRSADRDRYDADPQVLGDDFASLQMKDYEGILMGHHQVYDKLIKNRAPKANG